MTHRIQRVIEIGPAEAILPGAMKLALGIFGDEIESVDMDFGYLSKDLSVGVTGLRHEDAMMRIGRINPELTPLIETLFVQAVEDSVNHVCVGRAAWIRDVLVKTIELSYHLRYLAVLAKRVRVFPAQQVIQRHREDLMDLIELLTGSRFGYHFVVAGGVRADLSDGFSVRLERWIKAFQKDHGRIEALFYWVGFQREHWEKIGMVVDRGGLGFVSQGPNVETRLGWVSHVDSRLRSVLYVTKTFCADLMELLHKPHSGVIREPLPTRVMNREVVRERVSDRGDWRMRLDLDQQLRVNQASLDTPSQQIIKAVEEALLNEKLDDVPLILQSLHISVPEVDQ